MTADNDSQQVKKRKKQQQEGDNDEEMDTADNATQVTNVWFIVVHMQY
jgi:hypothetical protein